MTLISQRYEGLRNILEGRRDEVQRDLISHRQAVREVGGQLAGQFGVIDDGEVAECDARDDMELSLAQMRSETLHRIKAALERHEQDDYGYCSDCGDEIAEKRLLALPFAIRCRDCEEARENEESIVKRRGLVGCLPFFDE